MKDDDSRYDNTDVEIIDLDDTNEPAQAMPRARIIPPSRDWTRRNRRTLTAASAALVVLVVVLILVSSGTVRGLVDSIIARYHPAPVPTPTLYPGLDLFYVEADPSWGHLWIDGHLIAHLPVIDVDAPLSLSRGGHTLTWRAAPFNDFRCTLSVPRNYDTDSCSTNGSTQLLSGISASIVMLNDTLSALPDDQQTALIQATQQALDAQQSSDIVQPGEHYVVTAQKSPCQPALNQPLCYAVATRPLRATLRFALDVNPNSTEGCIGPELGCTLSSQNCRLFCSGFAFTGSPNEPNWIAFVPVKSLWTFATMDGRIFEQEVPDNLLWDYVSKQQEDESLVELAITWNSGGWYITVPGTAQGDIFDPACVAVDTQVQMLLPPLDANQDTLYLQWQFASGSNPAEGCVGLGALNLQQFTGLTPPAFQAPYILHRFGVMLAANAVAQRLWPQLPVADAHEQQLTRQLAALVGSTQS